MKSLVNTMEKYLPEVVTKVVVPMLSRVYPFMANGQQTSRENNLVPQGYLSKQADTKPQKKWHGTIGIIGLDPTKVVTLNKSIVEYGNSIGFTDDQQFPEILSIGIKSDKAWYLEDQANLCNDMGCDVVAVAGDVGKDLVLKTRLETANHPLPLLFLNKQDMKGLAKEALDYARKIEHPRRPNLLYSEDGGDFGKEEKGVNDNLALDIRNRGKRSKEREQHGGGYPFLKNVVFGGIIGGGGPLASADFCEKLAKTTIPFIHYSVNSAPGKYRFEMSKGPSFVNHYRNAVSLFNGLGAAFLAVPCNTAHKRAEEFCGESMPKLIDIRESVLGSNQNAEGFILLGTKITTGVGMPTGVIGTYESIREKFPEQGPFHVPSPTQQGVIMDSIYDVKAGRLEVAKEKILKVVDEMRSTYGHLPVILACTELPLANFEPLELVGLKLIDPAESLASKAADRVEIAKLKARERPASSTIPREVNVRPVVWENDLDLGERRD